MDEVKVPDPQREQQLEDVRWMMGHPQGRRFVTRLLEEAGVHRTVFHTSGSVMAFNEGKRTLGLFVQGEVLEAAPEAYLKLLQEYAK